MLKSEKREKSGKGADGSGGRGEKMPSADSDEGHRTDATVAAAVGMGKASMNLVSSMTR